MWTEAQLPRAPRRRPVLRGRPTVVVLAIVSMTLLASFAAIGSSSGGASTGRAPGPVASLATGTAQAPVVAPYGTAGPARSAPFDGAGRSSSVPFVPKLGHFTLPGPRLSGWGASGVPPGAEALGTALAGSGSAPTASAASTPAWDNRFCAGLWPWAANDSASQSYYANGCYGHDEPGIEFYSGLNGSGGNVTWNVTLPVDRSATQNQSDLYVAIWFGMTLNDPMAWMHQCFLELQFYPDQSWTNPGPTNPSATANGVWVGAAVAWQIEASTGYEDPCFYQPLYLGNATSGPGYFNMTQGDHLTVTMTGWANDPAGESIVVNDLTQGTNSSLVMYNSVDHYPVDPSYATNSYENALQWTPGGEYPVVFAFENGHAGNPSYPSNNSYGGCSPGKPPASPTYPSVPCPSYDPSSWANDTLHPWRIGTPTFFNAAARSTPAQVAFTQDFGGAAAIASIGGGACSGQLGSAWCSYPWYSYSCAAQAFEFGATDYPGVSADFGQYNEYSQVLETNGLGFGFFPPTNFSIPACGRAAYNVTVAPTGSPGGAVYFLSSAVTSSTAFGPLLPGEYSIRPYAPAGAGFTGWTTTGGVSILGSAADPWATLVVTGPGAVRAVFGSAPTTAVTFEDTGTTLPGSIVLSAARLYTDGAPLATMANGSAYALSPGIYGVQALAPPGSNFSGWSVAGTGVSIAPDYFPYAWLDVSAAGGNATLTATYAPSSSTDTAYVYVSGNGTATLNGTSTSSFLALTLSVGAYAFTSAPAPGWAYAGLYYGSSAVITDFNPVTNVSLENGSSYLYVYFTPLPVRITLDDAPAIGGTISADYGTTFLPNGATVTGVPGDSFFAAAANAGYAFTSWSVNSSLAADVLAPTASVTVVLVNASVTLTAHFAAATYRSTVAFAAVPAAGGSIEFNGVPYTNGTSNTSVANGTYLLTPVPAPGYSVVGPIVVNGSAVLTSTYLGTGLTVNGSAAVTVDFARAPVPVYPVTFVANVPYGVTAALGNVSLTSGSTAWVSTGSYALNVTVLGNETFEGWSPGPGLHIGSVPSIGTTLNVSGPGSFTALVAPFGVATARVSPNPADVGVPVTFVANVSGAGPYTFAWSLPAGCAGANASTVACAVAAGGSYPVSVNVTDGFGAFGRSPVTTLVVHGPVGAGLSFSPGTIDLGMTANVTVVVTGGTGPFSYAWGAVPAGCTGTGASLRCTPTISGTLVATVNVSDAFGRSSLATAFLIVNPRPSVSAFLASPPVTDVGVTSTLTVSVTGGTGPFVYAYSGLPAGCAGATTATFACTPAAAGSFVVRVNVTDTYGYVATETAPLTVDPAPALGPLTATRTLLDVGMTTSLSSAPSGGTTPYAYSWSALPPGCVGVNASSLACTPVAPATVTVIVTMTDARGASAQASVALTVDPRPSISLFAVSAASVAVGGSVTFSLTATGGTGGLAVRYSALPPGCTGVNVTSITCAPSAAGAYSVGVRVTDALGQSANATVALTVTSSAPGFLSTTQGDLTIGLLVLAAVVLLGVALLLRRRRGRGSSGPPAAWNAGADAGGNGAGPAGRGPPPEGPA